MCRYGRVRSAAYHLPNEVAKLTTALTAAQASQAELSRTVESLRRERDEVLTRSQQARADLEDAERTMTDDQEGAVPSIETAPPEEEFGDRDSERRDEARPDEDVDGLTRYERASAKLPSMGDEASEVIGSLEDLRESLRRRR
jgi:chromosome segregation ATPase